MLNRFILSILFLISTPSLFSQDCEIVLSGSVLDASSQAPLAFANVLIQEESVGTSTAVDGTFIIRNLCPGEYHLIVSHIGCEEVILLLHLTSDTTLGIELNHGAYEIQTINIDGVKQRVNSGLVEAIPRNTIERRPNQNLSELLLIINGVHRLQNGSGISKPIIHGLYGNRLVILNNEVIQSGQQWGNDHSPEIDPYAADKIRVIKGVNTLEYGGGIQGAVVLVEPSDIVTDDHIHTQLGYSFESNGLGHTVHARIEQNAPVFAWRLSGSFKKYGDRRSPDYFLNNTGTQEYNASFQLTKQLNAKCRIDGYLSSFNTTLGILRGSQIGNLSDLEIAFTRETPFFTEEKFSYHIDAPRQQVSHHLAKLKTILQLPKSQSITWFLAAQLNNRKEFDVRRSQRTDIPALSLNQIQLSSNFHYTKQFKEKWALKVGTQSIYTDNTNNPETGILPLIPDYRQIKTGLFAQAMLAVTKHQFGIGARYDYEYHYAPTISQTVPREIITFERHFHTAMFLANYTNRSLNNQLIGVSSSFVLRNPAINELYSFGLHQGVSGIEEGNPSLKVEQSTKSSLEYTWTPSSVFEFNGLFYYQYFQDYIYLNPEDEFRLTIRGAFPVFSYKQTDAQILGLDLSSRLTFFQSLSADFTYSFLRGQDLSQGIPLVFMPPNKLGATLSYTSKQSRVLFKRILMDDAKISLNQAYVFKQNHLLENQDFTPVPSAYYLLGAELSAQFVFPKLKISGFIRGENLLNTRYRDYLNRLRYFADNQGISIVTGVNLKF